MVTAGAVVPPRTGAIYSSETMLPRTGDERGRRSGMSLAITLPMTPMNVLLPGLANSLASSPSAPHWVYPYH